MKKMRHSRLIHSFGLLCTALLWLANSNNPPTGFTNAPFDGNCNNCHTGNANGYNGTVDVIGMPATVQPNVVYPLTITMNGTAGNPIKGGFQLVAVDGSNANAGILTPANAQSGTDASGGRTYLEHRGPKTFGGNPISWDFNWTSPPNASGNTIKFYFIGNFVNNNGGNSGDFPIAFNETYAFAGSPPVTATISSTTNVLCNGGNTGSATVEPAGGNPPYTYHWSNNQSTQTAVNLVAGTYLVTVTASGGSGSATASATITQPTAIVASTSVSGVLTCNQTSVTVTASVSGGVGPYTFNWSNGDTGNPAVYTVGGSQTVTITDANACLKVSPFTIQTNTTPPNAVAGPNVTLTCLQPTATLNGTGSSTGASFTYAWTTQNGNIVSGSTTLMPVVNAAGIYTLKVTNTTTGCTATASTNVTSSIVPPTATTTGGQLTCTTTSVGLTASTNAAQPAFAWSGPGFNSTLQNPVVTQAGTYTVTVTNTANGCTKTATATVTQNTTIPSVTASGGVISCTNPNVTLGVTTNAAQPAYLWSGPCLPANGQTLPNPSVTCAGTYTVTVTNGVNGCTNSATATVTGNTTPPTATATPGGSLTCAVSTVQVAATTNAPNATFAWSGPGGFTAATQNINVQTPGNYTVTITSTTNACTATAVATVAQNTTPPTATAAVSGPLTCTTTTVQVAATTTAPNATFAWTGPGGFMAATQNINVQTPGNYTVTITSTANGCSATAVGTVVQNTTPPTATAVASGPLTCTTTTVQVAATTNAPNATFAWTGPGGFTAATQNINVQNPGTYTVAITSTANGCTATAAATVTQNTTPPTASIATPGNLNCNATSIQLNALASSQGNNFSYLWTTSNGNILSGANTLTPTVNAAGSYNLLITNTQTGCTATATTTVSQTPPVNASITNSLAVSCNGGTNGSATAAATGGTGVYSYLWSSGANTATAANLSAGVYTVTITDANTCTGTASVTISQPAVLAANASATSQMANGVNNGTATAAPTGGTAPYGYLWSNGGVTATITGLAPGAYTVTVTDSHACTAIQTVTVNSFNCNLVATVTASNVTCNGAMNGAATVTLTGGTQPITYLWSNGAVTASISGLTPGNYTVSITDASGCPAAGSVSITEPAVLAANATATAVTGSNTNDGTATAQPTGGTAPYTYLWNTGATTALITGLAPGAYSPTVTDAHGCTASQTVTVNGFNCTLATNTLVTSSTCPESANGSATAVTSGGSAPFTFLWSNGAATATAGNLSAGVYTVTVHDAASCVSTASATVISLDTIAPALSCPGSIFLCGADIVTYPAPVASDNCALTTMPVLISGQASGSAFNDGVTTQVFSVTDASGNTSTCSFSVTVFPTPDIIIDSTHQDVGDGGIGSISVSGIGGTGPYTFIWKRDGVFFSNNEDLTGLQAGVYTLTMSDINGCQVTLSPITIDNIVGLHDPFLQPSIRIWPNPANAGIWLKSNNLEVLSAGILSTQGQLVQTIATTNLQDFIAIDALPTGIYYLKIVDTTGKTWIAKLVKAER